MIEICFKNLFWPILIIIMISEKQSKFVLYVKIIQFSMEKSSLRTEKDIIETKVPDLYIYLEEELQAENIKYKVHGA